MEVGKKALVKKEAKGSEGSGSSKVDPPGVRYHVRITLKKDLADARRSAKFIALNYTNRWLLSKYLWSFEYSESGQPHIHGAITMPQAYLTGTMTKFMANYEHLTEGVPGYRHEQEKDELKNSAYIIKDLDIIYTNITNSELEIIKNKALSIQEDMKMSARDKVYMRVKAWYTKHYTKPDPLGDGTIDDWCDFKEIKKVICDIYVDEWDKLPPVNLRQIAIYCAIKGGFCYNVEEYL